MEKLGEALRAGYEFDLSRNGLDSIRLLLLTGCRRQEILGLRWEEVEFGAQCLRLADTKSGPQTRPIGNAALDVIRDRDRSTKYVFPADSPTGHYVGLPKIWAAVARRAGLTPMSIHGMRHRFASAAAEMNFSELIIAGMLGHSFNSVTARYAVTPDTALIAAADQVSERLSDLLGINVS
ncbi:MAG: site-specific integrase [Hyphomicrobiales bacterium]|nr:site-specific integrase [Hyphomicrobiales bacterium]